MSARTVKESAGVFEAAQLDDVRAFVRDTLLESPLPRSAVTSVLLAVEEAVTNVHRHGYLLGEGTVRVTVERRRDEARIVLCDRGRSFEPSPAPKNPDTAALAESGRKGGLGVFLIEKVMDEVHRRRSPDGENVLVLVKRYGPRPAGTPAMGGMRARLALVTGAVVLVAVAGFTGFTLHQTAQRIDERQQVAWDNIAAAARTAFAGHILNRRSDAEFDQLAVGIADADPTIALIVCTDNKGTVLAHSADPGKVHTRFEPPEPADGPQTRDASARTEPRHYQSHVDDRDVRMSTWPIAIGTRRIGALHIAGYADAITGAQADARANILLVGGGLLVAGWLALFIVASLFVKPLARLTERVRRAGEQGLDTVEPNGEPDELAGIITSFNEAAERLKLAEREEARAAAKQRELNTARALQEALLPGKLPEIPGYGLAAAYRAAQAVGGDYYDCFAIDDHRFAMSVADVSGKGFPAALVMTTLRTAVRLLAPRYPSPKDLLVNLHQFCVDRMIGGVFATVFHLVLDTRTNTIEFASAGHLPMLFYRHSEGKVVPVNPKGMPVGLPLPPGVDFAARIECRELPVEPGDRWLLCTDGLTEAREPGGRAFGTDPAQDALAREKDFQPQRLIDELIARWSDHGGDTPDADARRDDLTLLVIAREDVAPTRRLRLDRPRGERISARREPATRSSESQAGPNDRIARWIDDHSGGANHPNGIDRRDLLPLLQVIATHPDYDPPQVRLAMEESQASTQTYRDDDILRMMIELRLETLTYRRRFSEYVAHNGGD